MKNKFIKKPKHIIRILKKEAKKLPRETYFAIDLYAHPKMVDGEWKRGEISEHEVNHGRRVKKIYKKWGMTAVNAYFYVKGQMVQQIQTKQNEESSN